MALTFYDWLKINKKLPAEASEIRSKNLSGHHDSYGAMGRNQFPILVTKNETGKLIQMENYVKNFYDVSDATFNVMLQDQHLHRYKQLVDEYIPIEAGIASDLRISGWRSVVHYLAYRREIAKTESKKLRHFNITGQLLLPDKAQQELDKS